MNIAFYAPLKPPHSDVPSGDRRVARALIQALEISGHRVDIASDLRSREPEGIQEKQAAFKREGEKIARSLIEGYQSSGAPDLWFTYHLYYKAPDWIGPIVAKEMDIPYVAAEASHAPKRLNGPWDLSHRHVEKTIAEADLIISLNSLDTACILPLLPSRERLISIRPFMEIPADRRRQRMKLRNGIASRFGLDRDALWLMTAAMMREGAKDKSFKMLSQALRIVQYENWRLVVAGDGPLREQVEQYFDGLPVEFAGELDQDRLFELMAASDIYLWPAIDEAYGMAKLEAQSQGLPVVAGDGGGVSDIVDDGMTGRLVELGNEVQFAKAVDDLCGDPNQLNKIGNQARESVLQNHDIQKAAKTLNQALGKIVHA